MDCNEVAKGFTNRHPWEISRRKCTYHSFEKYILESTNKDGETLYVNVGAGDCYFDEFILNNTNHHLYAVDIGYGTDILKQNPNERISYVNYLEDITYDNKFSYGMMMDSLEYMDDGAAYVKKLAQYVKPDGYLLFTLPAHRKLFSEYDNIVANKRRYDFADVQRFVNENPQYEIVEHFYFYFSLYCVRWIQLHLHLPIDPNHKASTGWKYSENSFLTKIVSFALSVDYRICQKLKSKVGLSLLVVLKKKG